MMQMVLYVMWYSPIGVIFLIAGNIAAVTSDLADVMQKVTTKRNEHLNFHDC